MRTSLSRVVPYIGVLLSALTLFSPPAPAQGWDCVSERLTYQNGILKIEGTLWGPRRPGVFPLLIYNHGSRPGQERQPTFVARAQCWQLITGTDLFVFFPERRGYGDSDGVPYSQEIPQIPWTVEQTNRAIGRLSAEADDVLAGLSHLQSRGIFDSERVAMIGFSLGGTVSVLAASKAPERFSAVVSQAAGVGIGRGQMALDMVRDELVRSGRRISSPVLIQHAVNDRLVPVAFARQLSSALASAGKTVRYDELPAVVQPDGHLVFVLSADTNRQYWWPQVNEFVRNAWRIPR